MWGSSKKGNKEYQPQGYQFDLTQEQQLCLNEFKEFVVKNNMDQNPWFNDVFYLRFCRARQFQIEKVIEMFEKYMQYREAEKIDTILQDFEFKEKSEVMKYYPRGYMGVCKKGRPIYIEQSGKIQPGKVYEAIEESRLWQSFSHSYEQYAKLHVMACSIVRNEQIFHCFSILDMTGFSIKMMNSKVHGLVKKAAAISSDNYPEVMGHMMIVNAPYLFSGVWSMIKGWIDEKTRNKIQIVGGGYTKELLKHIDEEQLASFLGGRNEAKLEDDFGPWNDFEVVDGTKKGDVVGVRRKADGPEGKIYTPADIQKLDNPLIPFKLSANPGSEEALVTGQYVQPAAKDEESKAQ